MIKLCLPFLLSEPDQIPLDLVQSHKLWLEPNIFDAGQLQQLVRSGQFTKLLQYAAQIAPIRAFHFPVEHADYLTDDNLLELLEEVFSELGRHRIPYLVLHSNHIRAASEFDYNGLPQIRQQYINLYARLAKQNAAVTICIENLPVIGNDGTDFDSVFVRPEDFSNLPATITIAWDFGHWAYTCDSFKSVQGQFPALPGQQPEFSQFIRLRDRIRHFHFSSFKKPSALACQEGISPSVGDYDPTLLAQACREVQSWSGEIGMTLEIHETDYTKRSNFQKTLDWFDLNVFK